MSEADVFEAADRALQTLAALAGLEQENMNRSAGWRFLDMGRRTERAINTCRLARTFAAEEATADDLDVLLDLIDLPDYLSLALYDRHRVGAGA